MKNGSYLKIISYKKIFGWLASHNGAQASLVSNCEAMMYTNPQWESNEKSIILVSSIEIHDIFYTYCCIMHSDI